MATTRFAPATPAAFISALPGTTSKLPGAPARSWSRRSPPDGCRPRRGCASTPSPDWWLERFEAKVAAGEPHPRTLEAHRYHLERNLLPRLASRRIAALGVEDVAALITESRADGRSAKSTANALGTLQGILRFARRRGWVLTDSVELLEPEERPRHPRRRQRVLGRPEIERLLDACPPPGRLCVATALYSGLRISELLGLTWEDIDFAAGLIR